MDFIKYIDFFSIKFSFYTNNQPNNQNIFGGIMTIIYVIICLLIFIIFSYDDLKKSHPITTRSEISDSERKIVNMNQEKIWIPFRMVNFENQFIDHRGIIYIVPYLIEGNKTNNRGMNLKYNLLNYKLCNETSMVNKPEYYKINIPLNQLFCIDKDEILFGGNWNHEYLYYLEINIYLCQDGISFNPYDPRCAEFQNFKQKFNSSLIFDFYFPMVQFQPTNLNTPIQIIYKNYYYRLSSYNYKIEKLYIREHILSDDKNMLNTKFRNQSCWGMSSIYSDDYHLSKEFDPISDNNNNSRVYALNIYMDDGLIYYTRTFKKIFLIISNVFPIFRFILYFIKKATQNIKMSFTKKKLIGLIFENKKFQHKKFIKKLSNNNNNPKSNNNILINILDKSENEIMKDNHISNNTIYNNDNNLNNNFNIIKSINTSNNNITIIKNNQPEEDNSKKDIVYNNNILNIKLKRPLKKSSFSVKSPKKNIFDSFYDTANNKKIGKFNRERFIFPYYYYFFDIIFDNLIYPRRLFCVTKKYLTVYHFMCQVYDISTHIMLFKQFNLFNNMLKEKSYKENGTYNNKLFSKININDYKLVDKLYKEENNKKSILYSNYFL